MPAAGKDAGLPPVAVISWPQTDSMTNKTHRPPGAPQRATREIRTSSRARHGWLWSYRRQERRDCNWICINSPCIYRVVRCHLRHPSAAAKQYGWVRRSP